MNYSGIYSKWMNEGTGRGSAMKMEEELQSVKLWQN
jgi:hypothetical protein